MYRIVVVVAVLLSLYVVGTHGVGYMDKVDVCSMYPSDYVPQSKVERQRIAILRQGHGC